MQTIDAKSSAIIESWFQANEEVFGRAKIKASKNGVYIHLPASGYDAFDTMIGYGGNAWAKNTARSFDKMLKAMGLYWDLEGGRIFLERL